MRMSSGASAAYEKPRSGRSICMLETPRSSRTASAERPLPASCSRTVAKWPWSRRAWTPARRRKDSREAPALASRAIATTRPAPPRSAASSDAWPPAPKVASTTVSPGCTARSRRTSPASTGTGSVVSGCKTFGNMLGAPFDLGQVLPPGGAVPDLEVVVHAGDHDVAAQSGVLDQRGRNHAPALLVGLGLGHTRVEEPPQLADLLAERVERGETGTDRLLPLVDRKRVEAAVEPARDDEAAREGLSKLGR